MALAKDLRIPGLDVWNLARHSNQRGGAIRLPIVLIGFGRSLTAAEVDQARRHAETVKAFYDENSYGKVRIETVVRTARLTHPLTWRGTWRGQAVPEPAFGPDGQLTNESAFPPAEAYEGYLGFKVFNRKEGGDRVRNYNASAERNRAKDALQVIASQAPLPLDDQISFQEFLSPQLIIAAPDMPGGGGYRTYGHHQPVGGTTSAPLNFGGITLNQYVFWESAAEFAWQVLAHEFGHSLGAPDLYISPDKGDGGDLDNVSIMGGHWGGNHLDALSKFQFGWLDPRVVNRGEALEIELGTVYEDPRNALLIRPDPANHPDEFFLVEHRADLGRRWDGQPVRFDKGLDRRWQQGLFIYHVNTQGRSNIAPRVDLEGEERVANAIRHVAHGPEAHLPGVFGPSNARLYDGTWSGLWLQPVRRTTTGAMLVRLQWEEASDYPPLCAEIFEHADYAGTRKALPPRRYANPGALGFPNDQISSVRVPAGLSVEVFEHADFRGESRRLTKDTHWIGRTWNDRVSSLIVREEVAIYQHARFRGAAKTLQAGKFNARELGIGAGELSSIRVPPGSTVILYAHDGQDQAFMTLTDSTPYVGDEWNDLTTSIEVIDGVCLYTAPEFGGMRHTLGLGRHDLTALGIPNDSASSVRVRPGVEAIFHADAQFVGNQFIVSDDTPRLPDAADNRVSSVTVQVASRR